MDNKKRVYTFGNGQAEGNAQMREILGGKGANLAEMNLVGVPVPPGFTIITDVCNEYYKLGQEKIVEILEQEVKAEKITPIDDVWNAFPSMEQAQVRAALARAGLKSEHIQRPMNSLSGGEQAKVRLCKLMMNPANILIFDEPTNHLDVDAKAELKRAMKEFKGTIILVSHEPEFYDGLVTKIWNVQDWFTNQEVPILTEK